MSCSGSKPVMVAPSGWAPIRNRSGAAVAARLPGPRASTMSNPACAASSGCRPASEVSEPISISAASSGSGPGAVPVSAVSVRAMAARPSALVAR